MRKVDFYFDYLSPFAYLTSVQIGEVCTRANAAAVFRPVLFPALLNHWGQRGPAEIPPKSQHVFKECLRYALRRDIPFRSPRLHPFNPLLALRVTWATEGEEERRAATQALYALGWARGGDLSSRDEVADALTGAGLSSAKLLDRAQSDETKQRLRTETDAAIARGVFGVPSMLTGNELFWGVSQLENLAAHLSGSDPLLNLDWTQLAPQGVGAWRRGVNRG
ncbi:MAG: 2-hydroxychromene-2-carboxylate isomerase [Myxococcales bacterium]|nr:2-hydroxychromene-2-carboxylate isomerase [Myxococcales bacterium]MDD9969343.1 2-hydroxychromene-2-carboxylate isomerase [Myxococcales bacterium]